MRFGEGGDLFSNGDVFRRALVIEQLGFGEWTGPPGGYGKGIVEQRLDDPGRDDLDEAVDARHGDEVGFVPEAVQVAADRAGRGDVQLVALPTLVGVGERAETDVHDAFGHLAVVVQAGL